MIERGGGEYGNGRVVGLELKGYICVQGTRFWQWRRVLTSQQIFVMVHPLNPMELTSDLSLQASAWRIWETVTYIAKEHNMREIDHIVLTVSHLNMYHSHGQALQVQCTRIPQFYSLAVNGSSL